MIRVKRDPTLCKHLNRDIGNICGWLNFGNKYCVSCIYFALHIYVLRVLEH
jgi:hypothetical protein